MAEMAAKSNKSDAAKRDPKKVSAEYARALDRLQELRRKFHDLETERRNVETQIQTERAQDPTRKHAEEVVAGADVPTHLSERNIATLREELGRIDYQRRVLDEAFRLQESHCDKLELAACQKVAENLAPEYQAKIDRLTKAMIELAESWQDIMDFRAELEDHGVTFQRAFKIPGTVKTGSYRDPGSWIARWLTNCVDDGLIDEKQIPSTWRKQWQMNNPGLQSMW